MGEGGLGIWGPGRGLGDFSHQRTVVVMVTLGRHPWWLLLLGSPTLGSGGVQVAGSGQAAGCAPLSLLQALAWLSLPTRGLW